MSPIFANMFAYEIPEVLGRDRRKPAFSQSATHAAAGREALLAAPCVMYHIVVYHGLAYALILHSRGGILSIKSTHEDFRP